MPIVRSLTSLLAPERVALNLEAASKAEALAALVGLVAAHPSVRDPDQLLLDVEAREQKMSTGVGEGLALPHARTDAVTESLAALATLTPPVPFDAHDGQPVRLVLFLAGPEADRVAHLQVLGRVSRVLSDRGVRAQLAEASSSEDVLAAIRAAESAIA